jgi:hypothetical protein
MIRITVLIMVIASIALFSGCASLIGLAVGVSSDASTPSKTRIASALPLERGAKITAIMNDSSSKSGEYFGFAGTISNEISDSSSGQSCILPFLYEPITIIDTSGLKVASYFGGFYYHRDKQNWIPFIDVGSPDGTSKMSFNLYSLEELKREDNIIARNEILTAFSGQNIPASSAILIKNSKRLSAIPLSDVDYLEAQQKRDAAKRGLIYGIIVDIVIWTSLSVMVLNNWPQD